MSEEPFFLTNAWPMGGGTALISISPDIGVVEGVLVSQRGVEAAVPQRHYGNECFAEATLSVVAKLPGPNAQEYEDYLATLGAACKCGGDA